MSTVWGTYLAPSDEQRAAEATWGLVPAVAGLVLARGIGPGRRWVLRGVVAFAVALVLLALGRLGAGEPQGLTNLLLPVTLLVLPSRRSVRDYLRVAGPATPARPRAPRRLAVFCRGPAGEGGQTTVEAIGVLAVAAAVVLSIGGAAIAAAPVEQGTNEIICSVNARTAGAGRPTSRSPGPVADPVAGTDPHRGARGSAAAPWPCSVRRAASCGRSWVPRSTTSSGSSSW